MILDSIAPEAIAAALAGVQPPLGHPLPAAQLGRRLAPHRRGRYAGRPFTRAAISLYRRRPEQQSPDFVAAFRSWAAAETLRQARLRVRFAGLTVDELLSESGYVQQLGADPVRAILAVGQLPPQTLLRVDEQAAVVECMAALGICACGQQFVKRSWNQRRCAACRAASRRIGARPG
jgi:hypothetical protein